MNALRCTPHAPSAPVALLAGVLVAWTASRICDRALTTVSAAPTWTRLNYRGRPVRLTGGVAVATGAVTGAATAAAVGTGPLGPIAVLTAGATSALAGAFDDLVGPLLERRADKGWRGHLGALRSGRLSGGAVKVLVISAGALVAAGRIEPPARSGHISVRSGHLSLRSGHLNARSGRSVTHRVVSAALIASTANLVNLFDLRPGRASKVTLVAAVGLSGGPAGGIAAATAAAAAAGLPGDLGETRMLGDLGANPLGALLGLRLAATRPAARALALVVVLALTALSERVSFSRIIDSSPLLSRMDGWGRLPADGS